MSKMPEKTDLTAKQKKRLLNLGLAAKVSETGQDLQEKKADTLYNILVSPLPVDKLVLDSLPTVLRGLCRELRSVASEPISKLLLDPQTNIPALKAVKEWAKQSGTSVASDAEGDAFLVVYYGAIASALVFHDNKVTQHSYDDLEQFFHSFSKETWVPNELVGLFTKAEEYCREKTQKKSKPL